MDYPKIISRSFEIIWKNRFLVFLGFVFWVFGGRATSTATLNTTVGSYNPDPALSDGLGIAPPGASVDTFASVLPIVLAFAVVFGLIGLVLLYVGMLAEGAAIASINYIEINGDGTHSLRESWGLAWPRGLQLFLIMVLSRLPSFLMILVFIAALIPTFVAAQTFSDAIRELTQTATLTLAGTGIVCINLLIAIPLSVLRQFAARSCIIEELDALQAYQRAWRICVDQFSTVVAVAAVRYLFGIGVTIATVAVSIILAVTCVGILLVPVILGFVSILFIVYWTLVWLQISPSTALSTEMVINVG